MSFAAESPSNPYVGPRAFAFGEKFYGRDREVRELLDLLVAERIVLLYSPSGAGKTSLIEAGLKPRLEEEFQILPVMRVSLTPRRLPPKANRYLLSLLLSLEDTRSSGSRSGQEEPDEELVQTSFEEFLNNYPKSKEGSKREVLIFDQFEEILTLDPTAQQAREEFFEQVGAALRDRHRWALFSMREEYRAALDPYLRPIPTRLSATFRLDLLGREASLEAIQRPAADVGVEFTNDAAGKLVDDLRKVRVQRPEGGLTEELGPYIEPVQLQVVCLSLWNKWKHLHPSSKKIEADMVMQVGDVDSALADYYADQVKLAADQTQTGERKIRDWFKDQLITKSGIRGQVLEEATESGGLSNDCIRLLNKVYLIRVEVRRNMRWYELAHDRLIRPVQSDNREWYLTHLTLLQRQAELWENNGNPGSLLLRGAELRGEELHAENNPDKLSDLEKEFLKACQEAREAEKQKKQQAEIELKLQQERQQARVVKRWLTITSVISILAVSFLALSAFNYWRFTLSNKEIKRSRNELELQINSNNKAISDLNESLDHIRSGSEVKPDAIQKITKAEQTLQAANELGYTVARSPEANRSGITVQYFDKVIDQNKVDVALKTLDFQIDKQKPSESVSGIPTNCVWYGSEVGIENAKSVAYALIRAGIEVKAIKPIRDKQKNTRIIQVGGARNLEDDPPLTVEQIRGCKDSCP